MKLPMGTSIRRIFKSDSAKVPVGIDEDHKTDSARKKPWREVLPETLKYEQVFGSELQRINPNLVHAQDIHLLSVAAKHVEYRKQQGSTCGLIYDAHEYIRGLGSIDPQRRDAFGVICCRWLSRDETGQIAVQFRGGTPREKNRSGDSNRNCGPAEATILAHH
jgi:hypothetical protein